MPTVDELIQMMRTISMNEIRQRLIIMEKKAKSQIASDKMIHQFEGVIELFQPRVNTRAEGGFGK